MTSALSFYLDALRFAAAFTVFLCHYGVARISGGLWWQFERYGHTAVLVFFVLSGFVIAGVTDTRERTLEEYALSRAARLYSVMIPAFLLTAVLDWIGGAIDPALYAPASGYGAIDPAFDYVLSAVFLGESWTLTALPGFNVPFWSLNYEAWYYILFAAAVFLRGRSRVTTLALATLAAGPKVLLLLPIWLMGTAVWQWRAAVPAHCGWLFAFGGLSGFVALEALGGQRLFWHANSPWLSPEYSAYDYAVGAAVAALILGLASARLPMPSARVERAIRGLAGTTFALYLLHYPLLNFFAAAVPGPPQGGAHRLLVFGLALASGLGLGRLIEPHKRGLKRALQAGLNVALGRRSEPDVAVTPLGLPDCRREGVP